MRDALRVANAVCDVQELAAQKLLAFGIDPWRIRPVMHGSTTPPLVVGDGCGIAVDEHIAALVQWWTEGESVVIALTWMPGWEHLADGR